ncbi:Yip1 family protein [Sporosalibacterium faouarense]|uniref:Yip1 family protein n=1 Tax=Sporosalibacterium faouarense TaxID=516123 RepID=UPI00141D0A77|nr:Yip1 family protein [Sporosalibacterium faouarense]MTI48798.1 YIP1 family protein [Bacillota bacterium]
MGFFKRIIGVITNPKDTLEEISNSAPIWQAISINVILGVLSVFITLNRNTLMANMGPGISPYDIEMLSSMIPMFMVMGVFFAMIVNPLFHFIETGMYNLISEFLGYKGSGKGLFSALGFASVPGIFSIILLGIFSSINLNIVSTIISIPITIWVIVLNIIAIKKTYQMGTGKATLTYFIPIIALIVVVGILIILGIITMIPIMREISGQFMY